MNICQKLYEAGFITYMRTDSKVYSKEFMTSASKYIEDTYGKEYLKLDLKLDLDCIIERNDEKKNSKDSKESKKKTKESNKPAAQEAHEAIRPTDIKRLTLPDEFAGKQARMYNLIWSITAESCMAPAEFKAITASISAPEEHQYRYNTETPIFLGWKIVRGHQEDDMFAYIKSLKNGEIKVKKIKSSLTIKDLKGHYTEAKLVQLLEEKGIGRPSTFSSIIDKIQERNYVKKENVSGKKIKCVDIELDKAEIKRIESEREFGNEKNKLVIQATGIFVLEFLVSKFNSLFAYTYTKEMEDELDNIAKGGKVWHELCEKCNTEITSLMNSLPKKPKKEEIQIDENHFYTIAKYGPVIKCIERIDYEKNEKNEKGKGKSKYKEKITYKPVRKDLDIDKLKAGEYTIDEILEEKKDYMGRLLGEYNGEQLYLKQGKFGLYVSWGENSQSLKGTKLKEDEVTLNCIKSTLKTGEAFNRVISASISIRKGKFGHYIFHQTKTMKKPAFYKLNGFEDDYKTCSLSDVKEWIETRYNIT
jgi:DNA topoisomerase-1